MEPAAGNYISPDALGQYALDIIVGNYKRYFTTGIPIPYKISDAVFAAYQRKRGILDEDFLKIFELDHVAKLTKIHLMRCSIEEKNIHYISALVTESVRELSLYTEAIPKNFLHHLNKNAANLEVFSISGRLLQSLFNPCFEWKNSGKAYKTWPWILKAPKLKFFCVKWNRNEHQDWLVDNYDPEFIPMLLAYFTKLRRLEIGGQPFSGVMTLYNAKFLNIIQSSNFTSLVFNGFLLDHWNLKAIESLKHLEHLDISGYHDYYDPGEKLKSLIMNLQRLKSLDISETNLDKLSKNSPRQIYGLQSLKNKQLEFLGLYRTRYQSCRLLNIPANEISGHLTLKQLLNTARMYSGRMKITSDWLNYFDNITITQEDVGEALYTLLKFMGEMLDFGLKIDFTYAVCILRRLLTEYDLDVAIKWRSLKAFFNIFNRSDIPYANLNVHITGILSHLLKPSMEWNYFKQPFIDLIFIYLKNKPPYYSLALYFSWISNEDQRRLFVDQGGMSEMMESVPKVYSKLERQYFWETMLNLINGSSVLTEKFLMKGVDLFSELLPDMLDTWNADMTVAAKVYVQIIIQFKDLSDRYFASSRFLESLTKAFTERYDLLSELPNFYLGFIIAHCFSIDHFVFSKRIRKNVIKAFRINLQNREILNHNLLFVQDDLIDSLRDLMRKKNNIPECQSVSIWGLYNIILRSRTKEARDSLAPKLKGLKRVLVRFIRRYGYFYLKITHFAEVLCKHELIN